MKRPRTYSPQAIEAARLLGGQIRLARLERRWTVEELAERVGVNHSTLRKVERGDMSVGLGPALEAAVLVGVRLFEADPEDLDLEERLSLGRRDLKARMALVPARARRPREVDDDF